MYVVKPVDNIMILPPNQDVNVIIIKTGTRFSPIRYHVRRWTVAPYETAVGRVEGCFQNWLWKYYVEFIRMRMTPCPLFLLVNMASLNVVKFARNGNP